MSEMPFPIKRSPYHGWLPRHHEVHKAFIKEKVTKAVARKERVSLPESTEEVHTAPVARFAAAVLGDSVIKSLFEQIFLQVNTNPQVCPD